MILPDKRLKVLVAGLVGAMSLVAFGFHYLNLIAFGAVIVFHLFAVRAIRLESEERLKVHPRRTIQRGIAEIMIPLYIVLSFAYFATPAIQQAAQRDIFLPSTLKQAVSFAALERVDDAITYWAEPYRDYFPPVLAFGLFLILWGLGFLLHRLATGLGTLIFWLLRKTGFVIITEKMIPSESISLWPPTTTKP